MIRVFRIADFCYQVGWSINRHYFGVLRVLASKFIGA